MQLRNFLAILVILVVSGCAQEKLFFELDNQQLKQMKNEGVLLIDIRRPEEWKQTGIVEGSQKLTFFDRSGNVNPEFMPVFSNAVSKDQPVMLICRTGNRTGTLARYLSEELGYTRIYNVTNGITDWIRKGNPVIAQN